MMYRYDGGDGTWMTIMMPFMWLIFVGLTVWLVFRLTRRSTSCSLKGLAPAVHGETPEEILDRRFAAGEIDAQTHIAARQHLREHAR